MRLEKLGKVVYFEGVPSTEELSKRVEGAEIIAVDWSPIDAIIPKMKSGVKLISLPFTGVGFLPLKEASSRGIKIANAPGYSTESVGEFGIGLMLALVRRIYVYAKGSAESKVYPSLYGKTIGILGTGRIGNYVGKISESLGMNVMYWKRGNDLSNVLKNSDIIYCALPLSDETKELLKEKEFGQMKNGAYFVTTSHNQIYNHNALLKALNKNLAGAAMDLEGINSGDCNSEAYLTFKNNAKILVTPHIAFKTDSAIERGYDMMIDNIEAFVEGKPTNIVN